MHIFGQLVHIFGQLAHIFGNLVHIFARKLVSRTSKQVSKYLGPLWQPGVYNDTNSNTISYYLIVFFFILTFPLKTPYAQKSLHAFYSGAFDFT